MASIVGFMRPRGINGNYKVGVWLDLKATERARVFRGTSENKGIKLEPTKTIKLNPGKICFYLLSRFRYAPEPEYVRIEIEDIEIENRVQEIGYAAREFFLWDAVRGNFNQFYNEVTLIDLDKKVGLFSKHKMEIQQVRQLLQESSN